jgi:2-polyprenyl-3-methyl-5-hydroxy-6-metoxy-1,4-benzoquinol methylase
MTRGPRLEGHHRVLDAGGTASLFSCQLASRGVELQSIDLNERLVATGNDISSGMGWNMRSHSMDMTALEFEDDSFDHAFSICVFEHLDASLRQAPFARSLAC